MLCVCVCVFLQGGWEINRILQENYSTHDAPVWEVAVKVPSVHFRLPWGGGELTRGERAEGRQAGRQRGMGVSWGDK